MHKILISWGYIYKEIILKSCCTTKGLDIKWDLIIIPRFASLILIFSVYETFNTVLSNCKCFLGLRFYSNSILLENSQYDGFARFWIRMSLNNLYNYVYNCMKIMFDTQKSQYLNLKDSKI